MQPAQTIVHQSTNVNDITYSSFQNKHKGEKIIVCGCGTTATLAPVGQNIIIGVNDIGRLFTPNYLVVLNDKHSFNQDRWSWIQTSAAEYCFTQFANLDTKSKKIQLKLGKYGEPIINENMVGYTSNSPYVACVIAAFMGATKIGLLGVDFTDNHFFDKTGTHNLNRRLPQITKEYDDMFLYFKSIGIEFVNLSPISKLNIPKISISNF